MSSIHRTWQTAAVIPAEIVPSREALVRGESATRSQTAPSSQGYLVFHYLLLAYLFLFVSRLPDLLPALHIGLLLIPIFLVGLVMTKQVRVLLNARSSRWLIGFTIWVAICVPFSFWPGGSFATLIATVQSLLMVAFIMAFVRSIRDVARAMATVGLASAAIAVLSFRYSSNIEDRQGLAGSGMVGDPNYFALYLLVGTAFLCLTVSQSRGWLRLCALALIPINLAAFARSGSRAGLISFAAGLLVLLVYGSTKLRTIILSACLIGTLVAGVALPSSIRTRFTNLLSTSGLSTFTTGQRSEDFDVNRGLTTAESSTEGRLILLRRSLVLTAKHPIFGVGPDQFAEAENEDAVVVHQRGQWHTTHNTYTQMSSELGIPGLIFYAAALFGSYRGLSSIRKHGPTQRIRQMALFLQAVYFVLMVGAFFLSFGYGGLPFILIGFSTAFKLAVRRYVGEAHTPILEPGMSFAV